MACLTVFCAVVFNDLSLAGRNETMTIRPPSDPEYQQLAPGFVVRSLQPETFETLEYFLYSFDKKYARFFGQDDIEIVESHVNEWPTTLLDLLEEESKFTDSKLSYIENASIDRPRSDLMVQYGAAMREVDSYLHVLVERLTTEIRGQLSVTGSETLEKLLRTDVFEELAMQYQKRSRSKSRFDYEGFAEKHPEVLARQVHLECAAGLWERKPGKLEYTTETVSSDPSSGQQLKSVSIVRREREQ